MGLGEFISSIAFRKQLPEAEWLSLAGGDLSYEGTAGDARTWTFPDGDAVIVYLVREPPELPSASTADRFLTGMREALTGSGMTILECSLLVIRTLPAIRIVGKQLGTQLGTHYFGSVLIPFAACSYTVNVKCAEAGITGVREAIVLDMKLRNGTVSPDSASGGSGVSGAWNSDPPEFDALFPDHPVSRIRRHLDAIAACLQVDDRLRKLKPFGLPRPE